MASIPLPALDIKTPQQPDLLANYSRLAQLRNMQQEQALREQLAPLQVQQMQQGIQSSQLENQQRQIALKDQQAMTSAMQQWDGKSIDDLAPLVLKNGGSANAVMGLKQKSLEMKKQYADIASADATTGAKNLETLKGKNDIVSGALSTVLQASDDQLPQALTSAAQNLAQQGLIDPQHAQMAAQIAQSGNPQQIRQQLDLFRKGYMANSQLLDEAQKKAQTASEQSTTAKNTAEANWYAQNGGAPGVPVEAIEMRDWLAKHPGKGPADYGIAMRSLAPTLNFRLQNQGVVGAPGQPSAVAQALANNSIKWNDVTSRMPPATKAALLAEVKQINPNYNSGDFQIEQDVRKDFTSGTDSNSLTAINRAREHMGVFMQTAKDLDNGNVQSLNRLGNAIGTEFGSDKATNLNIAKQAFSAEVGKAFAGASVAEGDRTELQKSISTASSFQQLAGAARTADALLAGAQKVLKQKYDQGRQGQPNFGGQPPAGAATHRYNPQTGQIEAIP